MISQTELVNNFKVSGSNITLTYERYNTPQIAPIKLFISNSSDTFAIQFFPTTSLDSPLSFTTVTGAQINKNYPITLAPNTGSNINFIELLANIDSTNFDEIPTNTSQELDITFNLVAVTSSLVVTSQPIQFGPLTPTQPLGGGGGTRPQDESVPPGFTPPPINEI
jgi:hypothetical protein